MGLAETPPNHEEIKERKRGSAASNDWREVVRIADGFFADFPFAEERVGKLNKAVHKALQSQRIKDNAHSEDHEWIRVNLAAMFAGRIEPSLKNYPVKLPDGSADEDNIRRKRKFGRIWRRNENYYFTAEQASELKELKYS
jgi:hypothetical protein